jgi:hypothetical protein
MIISKYLPILTTLTFSIYILFWKKLTEVPVNLQSVRTNNDVEGWHHRINRKAQKPNLQMYILIVLLHKEARLIQTQLMMVRGKTSTLPKKENQGAAAQDFLQSQWIVKSSLCQIITGRRKSYRTSSVIDWRWSLLHCTCPTRRKSCAAAPWFSLLKTLKDTVDTEKITKLMDYINNTWINGSTWKPASWTVYHQSVRKCLCYLLRWKKG